VSQRRADKRRRLEEGRFHVYVSLLELYGIYTWFATLQLHNEQKIDAEIRHSILTKAWRVADKLREIDEVEHLPEIVRVLFSEEFSSSMDRAKAMDALLDRMGRLVNPRYAAAIREISEANIGRITAGRASPTDSHAPGRMS
jgi:hypothetical protein